MPDVCRDCEHVQMCAARNDCLIHLRWRTKLNLMSWSSLLAVGLHCCMRIHVRDVRRHNVIDYRLTIHVSAVPPRLSMLGQCVVACDPGGSML